MMDNRRPRKAFDPKPFYPGLALIRIPRDSKASAKKPDKDDDFGTGFFVTKSGLLFTTAHNLTEDGNPDGNPLAWVWVCCYDPHARDWINNHKVPVDAGLINPKLDAAVLRVTVRVSAPLRLAADWRRGDDVVILGFQPDSSRQSGYNSRWLMCQIPMNWDVAPFDLEDGQEPTLRLGLGMLHRGQQPLGRGISGGPVLNCDCEGYPAIAIEKAAEYPPPEELRPPEIKTTAVHWLRETLDTLPEGPQITWLPRRDRDSMDYSDEKARSLRESYLSDLFRATARLPVGGMDPKAASDSGALLNLDAVYTAE